ncbi:MAG: EAL domain-containing protein [Thermomicrobiales bacterium]
MSQSSQFVISFTLFASAAISLFVAGRAWSGKQRDTWLFSVVMLAVAIWLCGYAAEILFSSLTLKLYAARVEYLGITVLPPFWLLFALSLTSRRSWITRRTIAALLVIPFITAILAWTSSSHGLLWSEVSLDGDGSASGLVVEYGAWFWVHTAYLYALLAASNAALIVMFMRVLRFYRRQASLMLIGLVLPWVANIAYLAGDSSTVVDPTPLALAFSGVMVGWGLWRWHLLDVKPIPRARSVEGMRDGVIVFDHRFRIIDCNVAAASMLDFDERQVLGKQVDEAASDLAWLRDNRSPQAPHRFKASRASDARGDRFLEARVSGLDGTGNAGDDSSLVVLRDITEQHHAEERLRAAEERYRTLIEQMPAVTYIREWSDQLLPSYVSPQIRDLLGYDPELICSDDTPTWDQLIVLDDLEEVLSIHRRATEQRGSFAAEYRLNDATGRTVWVRDEAVVIDGNDDDSLRWQGVIVDISDQKQLETQLERYAFYDTLTGLPNRALLLDRLQHSLARVEREATLVGILFIDLDGFKIINDTLGHLAGDNVLHEVARRLKSSLRTGDTAARLGGDEFVVVVENIEDSETILQIANRIIEEVQLPLTSADQQVGVSCSIGIRTAYSHEATPEDLLRDADIAMYWAKSGGRGRAVMFDPVMLAQRWSRLDLEAALRNAIVNVQIEAHYQPIISLRTGRISGFEALVRWFHPERGEILPDEFLPIAEESGLILPLDRWMLLTACQHLASWQERMSADGGEPPTMSVNVTPGHLQHPQIIEEISEAIRQSGISPRQLTLEITENDTLRDVTSVGKRLEEIRALGVKIIIDDFGTGYSALAYLRQFSISGIKIDRSFVRGLGVRSDDTSLVTAVVSLARSFGLEVTAEGVETQAQLQILKNLDVDNVQGFLTARPLPAEAIQMHIENGSLRDAIYFPDGPRFDAVIRT